MVNAAKAIIKLLQRRGFLAFFIGGKVRTELHNFYHQDYKLPINNINIITTATQDDIKKLFPSAQPDKLNSVKITFANMHFLISFFNDNVNVNSLLQSIKAFSPKIINAGDLDLERQQRDFTIDAIVQDKSTYIDFTYPYYRKDVSAINDIKHGIIRCIGDPHKKFINDPIRILRMVRLQSQLGYIIDKRTFNAAKVNLSLLTTVNKEYIKNEFNKIITGKFISKAFQTMQALGLFDLKLDNQLFMPCLKNIDIYTIKQVEHFNQKSSYIDDINKKFVPTNLIDSYIILLSSINTNDFYKDLTLFLPDEDINQIIWILQHLDIFTRDDLQQYFFKLKTDDYIQNNRLKFLSLIRHIVNIASILVNSNTGKYIYDAFCSKPLFTEQLRVSDNDIKKYLNKENYDKINEIKEAILYQLLNVDGDNWPYTYDQYMKYVKQGINDILPDIQVNIKKWPGKIDDYGNFMPHHKAVQYLRVPLDITKLEDLNISSFEELEECLNNKELFKEKLKQIKK